MSHQKSVPILSLLLLPKARVDAILSIGGKAMRILTADPKSAIVSTTMSKEKRGIDFVRNLIKGKIAEIIFHHMFSENEFCTVIPFGYENITPLLSQYQHLIETDKALENIRNNPDFILVKPDHTQQFWLMSSTEKNQTKQKSKK